MLTILVTPTLLRIDENIAMAGSRFRLSLALSLVCIACGGCSRSTVGTVVGIVSLDGKTLEGGSVTYYPVSGGPLSYADIAPGGSYHLRTASHDGVIPGDYVATVSYRSGMPSPTMTLREVQALEKVPVKYCTKDKSDLKVDVQPGKNSIDLKLTTAN